MTIQVGDRMPEGSFAVMSSGESASMSSNELFDDRKVVFVSVPGAFTPTCSMHHLPGLVRNADKILGKGVDTIACMAVNDVYVMNAWGEHLGVGNKLTMLADGNTAEPDDVAALIKREPAAFSPENLDYLAG